jgi:MFS family permease
MAAVWVGTAFTLAQAGALSFYGQAADILGRRYTMLTANLLFMIGSALF